MIIEINDISAPELNVYTRLTEAQLRSRRDADSAMFIAESEKVIISALDMGMQPVSMLMEREKAEGRCADLIKRCGDIPVYTAGREMLASLTGYELTRGILCAMRRPETASYADVCRGARRVVVLEGIVDPTNVGAIFRSAAALGMDAVLLSPNCSDPLHRRAARVSMGAVFRIPWAYLADKHAEWPQMGLDRLKEMGFATAAMALEKDSVTIDDPRLGAEPKLALFLGTEGEGLSKATIKGCDYTVVIPMSLGVDSLNVAAAGAVAFWQLGKR